MTADWPLMPASAQRGFEVWCGPGGRNMSETARLLGIPRTTVLSWGTRYRWQDRAAAEDVSDRDAAIASAYARMSRLLPRSVDVLAATLAGEDTPRQTLAAAFGVLDRFGISAIARQSLEVTARAAAAVPVSDAELDALVRAGDVAALLALAAGRQPGATVRALPDGMVPGGDDSADEDAAADSAAG